MEEMRNAHTILVGRPEGKRPLRRPRRSREDSIKMELEEVGWQGVEWIHLAQDRDRWLTLVNTVVNFQLA
jgi:hypothetical protein